MYTGIVSNNSNYILLHNNYSMEYGVECILLLFDDGIIIVVSCT